MTTNAVPPTDAADRNGEVFRAIDRMREAATARLSAGLSPVALGMALLDWSVHLAAAPGKRLELADDAMHETAALLAHVAALAADPEAEPAILPVPQDPRFRAEAWRQPPFSLWAQGFLLAQQWWDRATHDVPGVDPHHQAVVAFAARQLLDMASPANLPWMNPEVIARTAATGGTNLVAGWRNWVEDVTRLATGRPPAGAEQFQVGHDVAATPGKVVFRNRLIELIRYAPTTDTVLAEPVLLVPAWIMKYYILDLAPEHSLIRHLVAAGHTVFCISWHNPTSEDRDLTLEDYRKLGVMTAIEAISGILPGRGIHAAGYCLGGTLLTIAAAAMAGRGDDRLASVSLLTAQTDFTEPGELALFIDHDQLHMLESMMWQRGYLSSNQMAGAFQLLRSNDLVWSRLVHDYLMGEREPMTDMMAWNADATRMPYRMHAEYLRWLYLENALASGKLLADGHPLAVQNLRVPIFAVGTEYDHVAPWQSVYKIHYLTDTELTFVLASGGHNVGIVCPPGRPGTHYRLAEKPADGVCLAAGQWLEAAELREGSWWSAWTDWLARHSSAKRIAPPALGQRKRGEPAAEDTPGRYVLER